MAGRDAGNRAMRRRGMKVQLVWRDLSMLPAVREGDCAFCQKAGRLGHVMRSWWCPAQKVPVSECPMLASERTVASEKGADHEA